MEIIIETSRHGVETFRNVENLTIGNNGYVRGSFETSQNGYDRFERVNASIEEMSDGTVNLEEMR